MNAKNIKVSPIKSIPPVVGEFAYYDSRLNPNDNFIVDLNKWNHWLVQCEEKEFKVSCNYSLPFVNEKETYITCHGKINKVFVNNNETQCLSKDIRTTRNN